MSSASAILTALSDLTNNPKLEHYDPHLCKDIHIKLDKEAREQGLSYEERFEMVRTKIFVLNSLKIFSIFKAKKNMTVYDKWASIFPVGIAQCLKEYWKERMSSAPLDPRFPNVNQTK
jgi:hypothetical protein